MAPGPLRAYGLISSSGNAGSEKRYFFLKWSIIGLQCTDSLLCKEVNQLYVHIRPSSCLDLLPPHPTPPSKSSLSTKLSPVPPAGPHWLSTLHVVMDICQRCSPCSSHSPFHHCVRMFVLYICVSIPAPGTRFIWTIFLDSTYTLYIIRLFSSWTYFTLHDDSVPSTSLQMTPFHYASNRPQWR